MPNNKTTILSFLSLPLVPGSYSKTGIVRRVYKNSWTIHRAPSMSAIQCRERETGKLDAFLLVCLAVEKY